MLKKDRLFVLGMLIVVWFFISVIFILNILSKNANLNDGGERKRRVPVQGRIYSDNYRSTSLSTKRREEEAFSYDKYDIGRVKARRLYAMVKKIMAMHSRPNDDYYGFNVTKSDETPLTRDVPDGRPTECKDWKFNYSSLPTVSVVTPLHNEALTSLVRHVHAILTRTPPRLLMDIILVDDNSTFSYLGDDLQDYFSFLDSKIKIIRNKERKGLILSRLLGADIAQGEVIIFLDAHMEVCEGWVEPLLERINRHTAIVTQSDIISIDGNTLELTTKYKLNFRGGFGWDMRYSWFSLPDYLHQTPRTDWDPVPTPVLQGSCIAIRKSYFNTIGRFDPGLEIWGGEHFELSFNVWMTGGRVESVPCSKVGHIFKSNKYSFGSGGKNNIVAKNDLRVAEVWMDEYKKIVRAAIPSWQSPLPVFSQSDWESIEERRKLRNRRQSKSFDWFLKTVMPEQRIPEDGDLFFGEILNLKTRSCFYVMEDGYIGMTSKCDTFVINPGNTFALDKFGQLRHESKCVGFDKWNNLLKIQECPCKGENMSRPRWSVDRLHLVMSDHSGARCATEASSRFDLHRGMEVVQLQVCDETKHAQEWNFMFRFIYD